MLDLLQSLYFLMCYLCSQGDVANEVETEQLLYDAHVSSPHSGRFTSFVQVKMRVLGYLRLSIDVTKKLLVCFKVCRKGDYIYIFFSFLFIDPWFYSIPLVSGRE